MLDHVSPDLFIQLYQDALLLVGRELVDVGLAVDDIRPDLIRQALVHPIMLLDLFYDGEVLLDGLSVLPEGGDAVSDLVDDIPQHDDAEDLDEDNHKHFLRVGGRDVPVADGHDGGGAEVEGVQVEDVLVTLVDAERSHPVVVGVELGGREEDDGLNRAAGTMRCAMMKTVMIMSATFVWYSYCSEKLMRRKDW